MCLLPTNIPYEEFNLTTNIESLSIRCHISKQDELLLVILYNPPSKSKRDFIKEMDSFLNQLNDTGKHVLICGYMNINTSEDNSISNDYNNTILTNGFAQLINEATRITTTTSTIIDHIITNNPSDNANVEDIQISDHKITKADLHIHHKFQDMKLRKARCYKFLTILTKR